MRVMTGAEFRMRKTQMERFRDAALRQATESTPGTESEAAFLKIAQRHEDALTKLLEDNPHHRS